MLNLSSTLRATALACLGGFVMLSATATQASAHDGWTQSDGYRSSSYRDKGYDQGNYNRGRYSERGRDRDRDRDFDRNGGYNRRGDYRRGGEYNSDRGRKSRVQFHVVIGD